MWQIIIKNNNYKCKLVSCIKYEVKLINNNFKVFLGIKVLLKLMAFNKLLMKRI